MTVYPVATNHDWGLGEVHGERLLSLWRDDINMAIDNDRRKPGVLQVAGDYLTWFKLLWDNLSNDVEEQVCLVTLKLRESGSKVVGDQFGLYRCPLFDTFLYYMEWVCNDLLTVSVILLVKFGDGFLDKFWQWFSVQLLGHSLSHSVIDN